MPASLRALLSESIDYAGLFPPCSLDVEPALKNHAQYMRSADTWMLCAFVLPVAKFDAAAAHLAEFDRKRPLHVSAVGPRTENASAFQAALRETVEVIRRFSINCEDRLVVSQLEMVLPTGVDLRGLSEARATLGEFPFSVFWE